ncbi:MAG: type II secretion system minor pseudopilin GspK [Desulfuromonadaceae bacterium]|nr:type II secretion system minor pseudopilin GspK [Desulfuromonadaceae bacterium]MDD2854266.1 type II secretion system minor pseudopilin GspK [Desulfuromonadaceae bacterium]
MRRPLNNESGFALIMTLVVTALMVAVVVEMVHQVYVDTSLSRGFRDGQQASILAGSGAEGGAQLLQRGLSDRSYTSLTDPWAKPVRLDSETGSLEITFSEESGKVNINALVQPNGEFEPFTLGVLKRLGERLQLSDEIWGAVADWIDSNDLPRSGGVESPYYRTIKPPYNASNAKLMTLSEISLIKGITPELAVKMRPFLTTFSDQPGSPLSTININTAPKEIIEALDDRIDERMAERIIEERGLQPFKSTAELSRVPGLDTVAIGLVGKISVKGNLFKIRAISKVKDSGRTVEAIVRLSGSAPEFLAWQEY